LGSGKEIQRFPKSTKCSLFASEAERPIRLFDIKTSTQRGSDGSVVLHPIFVLESRVGHDAFRGDTIKDENNFEMSEGFDTVECGLFATALQNNRGLRAAQSSSVASV
jgi:hypothetical protein